MTRYLLYNARFYQNNQPLVGADNRGLRYGDGLFETLRYSSGTLHFSDWHFERLLHGMHLLMFKIPSSFTPAYLTKQVIALTQKNALEHARIRINVFRGNGGLYDPENHHPNCIIQASALPGGTFMLNENGLVTGIYRAARKVADDFSNIKSNNSLPYTMAALHARQEQWNDALLLNNHDRICDASIANIFIIKNDIISTCPLTEGCVAGIIRRYLVEQLTTHGFTFISKVISAQDVMDADEVFLTNSIKGILWVKSCGPATYGNELTKSIFQKLFKKT